MDKAITPIRDSIRVNGVVSWNEGRRRIAIKKPIRDRFNELNNRSENIYYTMELHLDKDALLNRINEHIEQGIFPVLLFFHKKERK